MKENTISQIGDILQSVQDASAMPIQQTDQKDILRNALSSFVVSQIEAVGKQEKFLDVMRDALQEKVEAGTVDTRDILDIVKVYSSNKINATATILAPFTPNNSAPSPLLPPAVEKKDDASDLEKALGKYSPSELNILDKVFRLSQQKLKEEQTE